MLSTRGPMPRKRTNEAPRSDAEPSNRAARAQEHTTIAEHIRRLKHAIIARSSSRPDRGRSTEHEQPRRTPPEASAAGLSACDHCTATHCVAGTLLWPARTAAGGGLRQLNRPAPQKAPALLQSGQTRRRVHRSPRELANYTERSAPFSSLRLRSPARYGRPREYRRGRCVAIRTPGRRPHR
jgi:hypothetical protein